MTRTTVAPTRASRGDYETARRDCQPRALRPAAAAAARLRPAPPQPEPPQAQPGTARAATPRRPAAGRRCRARGLASRAGAFLIDYVVMLVRPVGIVLGGAIGGGLGGLLVLLGYVAGIGAWVWNVGMKQAEQGQSIGKGIVGLRLIKESDGRTPAIGLCLGRSLLHIVDAIPCYVGYLWPIWDQKRQTFADKIVATVVLKDQPKVSPF